MNATQLKPFQEAMRDSLVRHFGNLRAQYVAARGASDSSMEVLLRLQGSALILQAPTGVGKTLIAVETVQAFSAQEMIVWFWFVPFTSLISQARHAFQAQAPAQTLMDVTTDRFVESLRPGAVYILSWQSVAARRAETRVVRETRDDGLSVDELIAQARELGYRIGCVVDEAHHGFHRASESIRFFTEVLKPDYTLMMTATPRDEDALTFSETTKYEVGPPDTWPTISREQGVEAGLLKSDVKTVRFIARQGMEQRIVDFERLALAQCWAMHKSIRAELESLGAGFTPLMLVQVPNGAAAVAEAEQLLIGLGVPAGKIRTHTADEPDDNLAAIANDSGVEVLIFKMAIAMGFDAPRAFTLGALRGVRDQSFGIQVVGRIMRVHRLLQGRTDVPALLNSGYVFLANEEDQEGLRTAAELINDMAAKEAAIGPQSAITVSVGDTASMQIVRQGESYELSLDGDPFPDTVSGEERAVADAARLSVAWLQTAPTQSGSASGSSGLAHLSPPAGSPSAGTTSIAGFLATTATRTKKLARKTTVPATLKSERMPPLPDNIEQQIVGLIDFTPVLVDRDRLQTKVTRRLEGLFGEEAPVDETVLARMAPAVLAEKAKQIALEFDDLDQRDFLLQLQQRFREALTNHGIDPPAEVEMLREQLDLVLVRNPRLLREAQRRVRASLIELVDVEIPAEVEVPASTARAAKNVYGIFPAEMNTEEHEFAKILDRDADVIWWHRNIERTPTSVVLYAWSGGLHAFFPDFVVAVNGRIPSDGVALAETKGPHLLQWERAKAGARHQHYGRVFMVGRQTADGEFLIWKLDNEELALDGVFEVQRLRFDV
jgi:superfamily II DNA or RNA helicase